MSRSSELPRLVNFSDSDMSTDSDSDNQGKEWASFDIGNCGDSRVSEKANEYISCEKTQNYSTESTENVQAYKKHFDSRTEEESIQKFTDDPTQSKYRGRSSEAKFSGGGSGEKRSVSRGRRSESRGGRSRSRSRRSDSRGRRSGSRGRRSSSRDRSRSRGRRSTSGFRRSRSRGRRSGSRGRRSRSASRDRRRRSRSSSRGRYRRSRSGSRGKHRRSRSGSRRRKDRRHGSPRRSRRSSPPRAHRTLDTLEKLGIELRPAAPPDDPRPSIPSYYNRMAVNPTKYAQQMAKKKLIWGSKTSEEGTAKASTWQGATFSQDQDGKMTAKFKRLMGIKEEAARNAATGGARGQELSKRQQELFSSMELQYEAARQATHTQRGVGLGFSSHPHHFPS